MRAMWIGAASVLGLVACTNYFDIDFDDINVDPGEFAGACDDFYDACIRAGQGTDFCEDQRQTCEGQEPREPGDGCEERYEECLDSGRDPETCDRELQACYGQGEPPQDECEERRNWCLEQGEPEDVCEAEYQECRGGDDPDRDPDQDPGRDPNDGTNEEECYRVYEECLDAGNEEQACEDRLNECLNQ